MDVDLPELAGRLHKKAIGKNPVRTNLTFAQHRTPKPRWFKLQDGSLNWFKRDDLRPSSLKGTLGLKGCLVQISDDDRHKLVIRIPDGKELIILSDSEITIRRWHTAISHTIDLLHNPNRLYKRRPRIYVEDEDLPNSAADEPPPDKSKSTINKLSRALSSHFLFKSTMGLQDVIDMLVPNNVRAGDVICWQGDPGDKFFVLEHGTCEVVVDGKRVTTLNAGSAFGELALIHNLPRAATIRAVTPCVLWAIDRVNFRGLLAQSSRNDRDQKLAALNQVSLFQNLSRGVISRVVDVLEVATFEKGNYIIRQGDVGDQFYIVKAGDVAITQTDDEHPDVEDQIAECHEGDCFGELALMQDETRKANVIAASEIVECYTLDRNTFTSMMGSLKVMLEQSRLVQLLKNVRILKDLRVDQLEKVACAARPKTYREGEVIINQGDVGSEFFIVQEGCVQVVIGNECVSELEAGSYFGELALISNQKRAATVISKGDDTRVQVLGRHEFDRLLGPLESLLKQEAESKVSSRMTKNMSRMVSRLKNRSKSSKSMVEEKAAESRAGLEDLEVVALAGKGIHDFVCQSSILSSRCSLMQDHWATSRL